MTIEPWMVVSAANLIMVIIFGLMAGKMISALHGGNQWKTNPILLATAAVFVTCTLGHGVHLLHSLEPLVPPSLAASLGQLGFSAEVGEATRVAMADPVMLAVDGYTAVIAIVFWIVRSRLEYLVHGHALNVDMEERQTEAMEIHDNVVQGLVEAKLHLEGGDREAGRRAIERSLQQAKQITSQLLGDREAGFVELGERDLRLEED